MSENKERKKIRELIKVNKKTGIAVTVLACLLLVGVSITVYSKYYKTGYNPGMAIASGFYFNSNYMASVDELDVTTEEDLYKIPNNVLESIIVSANPTRWTGEAAYPFYVEVRNYDNQLLYNDRDLDVEYVVCFMLLDEPVGADYYVKRHETSEEGLIQLQWKEDNKNKKGEIVSFSGTLPGGQLNRDIYDVEVHLTSAEDYVPARVLMVAYPVGPDFLQGTKSIAGILTTNYQEKEFDIEKANFKICETEDFMNAGETANPEFGSLAWRDVVLKESGFVYQVYTSGTFSGSGSATRKRIKVMWRADMFKINNFDTYYQEVKNDSKKYHTEEIEDESGNKHKWQVMEIDVLPYSSLKFVFFRTEDFKDKIMDSGMNKDIFAESVKVIYEKESTDPGAGNP